MNSSPFTLRSDQDLIATFRKKDQDSVLVPKDAGYPASVEHYFAWSEPSGVYTYIVFKQPNWETPLGLVFQKNGSGSHNSPAGMCEWCHTSGPSDEIGLMTTTIDSHHTGGTWLCLDLSCLKKIQDRTGIAGKNIEKNTQKLMKRIGEFYARTRVEK